MPIWEKAWVQTLAKVLAGLIVLLIIIFSVLKPLTRGLHQRRQGAGAAPAARWPRPVRRRQAHAAAGSAGASPTNSRSPQARGLVAQDPKRGAQVVKSWVASR